MVISETFEVDGRAARTVKTLFRQPGMLTREFIAGRRARYSPPLRLYLVFSIAFFLLAAWLTASGILREPEADPVFDAALQARFLSDDLPTLMFVLLPVFALLMKIAYWRHRYFEHLIFSLHLHCAEYVVLTVVLPLEALADRHLFLLPLQLVSFGYGLAYFALAMRRVYRSGWLAVALRTVLVLLAYLVIVALTIENSSELAIITD